MLNVYWHGTTSNKYSSIMKHGLLPKVPDKQRPWSHIHNPDVENYPHGLYLTTNIEKAIWYANVTQMRLGGHDLLLVGVLYNPKRTDATLEWAALATFIVTKNLAFVKRGIEYQGKDITEWAIDLLNNKLSMEYPQCRDVLQRNKKVVIPLLKRIFTLETRNKIQTTQDSGEVRVLLTALAKLMRNCVTKLPTILKGTIALQTPVTFKGKTRIVLMATLPGDVLQYDKPPKDFKVSAKTVEQDLFEYFYTEIVYPHRLNSVSRLIAVKLFNGIVNSLE